MPVYEYRCTACNILTDIHHGFDDVNTEVCAACGGSLARSFNVSGIVFKGSGFYINDSRSAPASETPAASSDSSGGS